MDNRISKLVGNAGMRYAILTLLPLLLLFTACKWFKKKNNTDKGSDQLSWNILFKEGTDEASRKKTIAAFEKAMTARYDSLYSGIIPVFRESYVCPCDTLLYNINSTFINGSGTSVTSPPTPPAGPAGKGDFEDALAITSNIQFGKHLETDSAVLTGLKERVDIKRIDTNAILAVIDTGLDTTKFDSYISKLLWQEPANGATMYNFLPYISNGDVHKLVDGHTFYHGTVVTALALRALEMAKSYPRIMVLKALDKNKEGSVFSVSCAMSYAIRNKATLINESLGYYGKPDSILLHYINLCKPPGSNPIQLFVAAGNTEEPHKSSLYCNTTFNNNELTKNRTFYPASFSIDKNYITSVTTLNNTTEGPAFYQNYSNNYVSLGVLNRSSTYCTDFSVKFMDGYNEGSSFATPVASGKMMNCLLDNNLNPVLSMDDWKLHYLKTTTRKVTVNGNYIEYR